MATALGAPGAAVYVSPTNRSRWEMANRWVATATPSPQAAVALIDALSPWCHLVGVGLEGTVADNLRLKVYWRTSGFTSLSEFGLPLLLDARMTAFVDQVMAGRAHTEPLTFSAAFDTRTGELRDVKVDVSWHDRGADLACEVIGTSVENASSVRRLARDACRHQMTVACIGMGVEARGSHRVNVYLFQP